MTTKTILLAAAATVGLAASASVTEIKFTVKTETNGKVASKVISGLYDQESGKHIFWTGKKDKVAYTGTYFGLVNETSAGKKVGQNAELIWGDVDNPENVLVAGAWGSSKSKSGQVAGTLDGKPATGTWSAKLNTKKSYNDLLAKYGLTQVENKATGVIDDLKGDVAQAQEEAAEKVAAAEAKAAEDIKNAQDEGAAAVAAAEAKAAEDIAQAKAEADALVKKAQEEAAAQVAAKQAELDAKAGELAQATKELDTLVSSITNVISTIDDPDMPNMFSDYLADTRARAVKLYDESTNVIGGVESAYDAYTNSLDLAALEQAVEDAQAETNTATIKLAGAQATYDGWSLTNFMVTVIDGNRLDLHYEDKLANVEDEIADKQSTLNAALASFTAYTNDLVQTKIPKYESALKTREDELNDAKKDRDEAEVEFNAAKKAVDEFVVPTEENGGLLSFDNYVDKNNKLEGATELEKHQAYEQYKEQTIDDAKQKVQDDLDVAKEGFASKEATYTSKVDSFKTAQANLKSAQDALAQAKETGTLPSIETLRKELADLVAQKDGLPAEKAAWAAWKYSDDNKVAFADALVKAGEAVEAAKKDLDDATTKLVEAQNAVANKDKTQADRLDVLGGKIGNVSLRDAEDKALTVKAIRNAVDEFEEKYIGYRVDAQATIDAVDSIKAKLEEFGLKL